MNAAPDDYGSRADEEAPHYPPSEIAFNRRRDAAALNDCDDNTIPSELSTLIVPSTLTSPNYDHVNPDSDASSSSSSAKGSRKAFQLAALLGFLFLGALFGADAVYMFMTSSEEVSSVRSWNALDSPTARSRNANSVGPADPAEFPGKKKKKGKAAKKGKALKKKEEEAVEGDSFEDEEDAYEEDDSEDDAYEYGDDDDEFDDASEDDELIATTAGIRQVHQPSLVTNGEDGEFAIPYAKERCAYVANTFEVQNEGVTNMKFLREKYIHQSTDPNVFYRATALMFWKDFGAGEWGKEQGKSIDLEDLVLLDKARYEDGTKLSRMSTWTWITGDQHLSNFGAWRNRGGQVVFGVNDFDEAAIYDFHIDVLRIAISICSHGFTNGFSTEEVKEALEAFTYTYVKTAVDYVGGDTALVYELNPHTSTGALRDFVNDVEDNKGRIKMMNKFTEIGDDGVRRFIRNNDTRLEDVPPEIEGKIWAEMTAEGYGATMMKMGWKVRGWDDDFFTVLDVARRVGSGVGSYGVDRFYVLLKGEDMSLEEDEDGASVILDVKFEPMSAVSTILNDGDPRRQEWKAWYEEMFRNEADRTAQAQRRLTSYTDPYVGYLEIDGASYNVRQRSPYKSSFDYGTLTNHRAFTEFMEQVAVATATAHVRGTVAKSPGQFKHVIKLLLAGDRNRRRWSDLVAKIALSYRNQVLLDFECFKQYVRSNFPYGHPAQHHL